MRVNGLRVYIFLNIYDESIKTLKERVNDH